MLHDAHAADCGFALGNYAGGRAIKRLSDACYCAGVSDGGVTTAVSGSLRGAVARRSANGTQDTLTSPFRKVWQAMR